MVAERQFHSQLSETLATHRATVMQMEFRVDAHECRSEESRKASTDMAIRRQETGERLHNAILTLKLPPVFPIDFGPRLHEEAQKPLV